VVRRGLGPFNVLERLGSSGGSAVLCLCFGTTRNPSTVVARGKGRAHETHRFVSCGASGSGCAIGGYVKADVRGSFAVKLLFWPRLSRAVLLSTTPLSHAGGRETAFPAARQSFISSHLYSPSTRCCVRLSAAEGPPRGLRGLSGADPCRTLDMSCREFTLGNRVNKAKRRAGAARRWSSSRGYWRRPLARCPPDRTPSCRKASGAPRMCWLPLLRRRSLTSVPCRFRHCGWSEAPWPV
jgi:hypothetical protein